MKYENKKPCAKCPFTTNGLKGFLTTDTPEEFFDGLHGETPYPCHQSVYPIREPFDESNQHFDIASEIVDLTRGFAEDEGLDFDDVWPLVAKMGLKPEHFDYEAKNYLETLACEQLNESLGCYLLDLLLEVETHVCIGAAMARRKLCKLPRHPEAGKAVADVDLDNLPDNVILKRDEFVEYHRG